MFSKIQTTKSIENFSDKLDILKNKINSADAIVIGAGAGLSAAAGFDYSGKRFEKYFSDFHKKYGITDMYSGGFYDFKTDEEYWAWWSRQIYVNRYNWPVGKPYKDLLNLIKDKNYFVLTTNVDHQFQKAGFNKKRLFYTQGDYGLWQCSKPCHNKTYDNEKIVKAMVEQQKDMKIPTSLIPKCPICGRNMTMNLRCDNTFVQDEGWYKAANRYNNFINQYKDCNIVYLELGVGMNTPGIIKYNFWQLTHLGKNATYICINNNQAFTPNEIKEKSLCINGDISEILTKLN